MHLVRTLRDPHQRVRERYAHTLPEHAGILLRSRRTATVFRAQSGWRVKHLPCSDTGCWFRTRSRCTARDGLRLMNRPDDPCPAKPIQRSILESLPHALPIVPSRRDICCPDCSPQRFRYELRGIHESWSRPVKIVSPYAVSLRTVELRAGR